MKLLTLETPDEKAPVTLEMVEMMDTNFLILETFFLKE
jgi:hypothetical protein